MLFDFELYNFISYERRDDPRHNYDPRTLSEPREMPEMKPKPLLKKKCLVLGLDHTLVSVGEHNQNGYELISILKKMPISESQ